MADEDVGYRWAQPALATRDSVEVLHTGRAVLQFDDDDSTLDLTPSYLALLVAEGRATPLEPAGPGSTTVGHLTADEGLMVRIDGVPAHADWVLELVAAGVRAVVTAAVDRAEPGVAVGNVVP